MKINKWTFQWKMSFNPDPKTQALEINFSRKTTKKIHPKIFFNNILSKASYQKHLGLHLHSQLSFQKQPSRGVLKPLIHGQIYLIKLIWHIFWIKNDSIKFDVYTIKLVWSKLIKLVSKEMDPFRLVGAMQASFTFFWLSENFFWVC